MPDLGASQDPVVTSSCADVCPRCNGLGLEGAKGRGAHLALRAARLTQIRLDMDPREVQHLHAAGAANGAPAVCSFCGGSTVNVPFEALAEWLRTLMDPGVAPHLVTAGLPEGYNLGHAYTNVCDFIDAGGASHAIIRPESVIEVFNVYSAVRYGTARALQAMGAPTNEVED